MSIDPSAVVSLPERGVAADVLDDEVVIVDLTTGHYYTIDGTGCEIWRLLTAGVSVGDVISTMTARYSGSPEAIAGHVEGIVGDLLGLGLVVMAGDSDTGTAPDTDPSAILSPADVPLPFVPATLLGFDDMENLLLLDPVHEVDERGWPHGAPGN